MYDYYEKSNQMINELAEEFQGDPRKVIWKFIKFNAKAIFRKNVPYIIRQEVVAPSQEVDYDRIVRDVSNAIQRDISKASNETYIKLIQNMENSKDKHLIELRLRDKLGQHKESGEKSVPVIFITDNKYALPTAVAISSLMFNAQNPYIYDVYVVGDDLDIEMQSLIKESGIRVNIIDSKIRFDEVSFSHAHVTKAALNKFFLADIFPDISKALYLDSDMLFLDDLRELYEIELDEAYVGAVKDYHILTSNYTEVLHSIGIFDYFNSGMMLLNFEKMRKNNISKALLDEKKELSKDNKFSFMDQDAFNIVFKDKIKFLDVRYNFLNCYYSELSEYDMRNISGESMNGVIESYEKPSVLHIGGGNKPWNSLLGEKLFLYKFYRQVNNCFREIRREYFG